MAVRNLKFEITYNGKDFSGYQLQPNAVTVQQVIIEAWKVFSGEVAEITSCSRLDAGVHANHFVFNFKTAVTDDTERMIRSLNGIFYHTLQVPIAVYNVEDAAENFHSRFDSVGKHYRYLLWHSFRAHTHLSPRCWLIRKKTSLEALPIIVKKFEGRHDFAAFRAQDCGAKTTQRTITKTDGWVHPIYPELFVIDVWGEGFLKNMIRNIVGAAVDVATERLNPHAIEEAFLHKERQKMGQCAPAHALRLERVFYKEEEYMASAQLGARHLPPY